MMNRLSCMALVLVGLFYFSVSAEVTFHTGVDRDTITIGDPITFRMRIRRHIEDTVTLASEDEDGFSGALDVLGAQEPRTKVLDGNRVEETRDVVMTAYQVGSIEIPPVSLRYKTATGDTGQVRSRPVTVVVQSVRPEDLSDIRDLKPPAHIQARIPIWAWCVLGVFVLALIGVIWYFRRRKRRPVDMPPPPPVNWFEELEKVGRLGLLEQENFKQFYSLLSEILRRFLEVQTPVEAMEQTTYEIARDLRLLAMQEGMVQNIEAFLNEADLVKFAKFTPPMVVVREALERVARVMRQIEAAGKRTAPDPLEGETVLAEGAR